jgi:hypothetical protein
MQKQVSKAVYALQGWTIEKWGGARFYIAPTAQAAAKDAWHRPYATLQRATTAIARKLAEEWSARHARVCGFHGVEP